MMNNNKNHSNQANKNNHTHSPEKKSTSQPSPTQTVHKSPLKKNLKTHSFSKINKDKKDSSSDHSNQTNKFSSFLSKKKQVDDKVSEKLRKEIEELQKSYRYLQAEFANYKRNNLKEKHNTMKYAISSFLQDLLLNVLNDFNRALDKNWEQKDFNNFKQGIEIIHSQLIKQLKSNGVEELNPKGEIFDPHFHEALSIENRTDIPNHTITQVCRKGYKIHDRLIQPAQVIISKTNETTNATEDEKQNNEEPKG